MSEVMLIQTELLAFTLQIANTTIFVQMNE